MALGVGLAQRLEVDGSLGQPIGAPQEWIVTKLLPGESRTLSGSVLQDGGAPAADFAEHLDPEEWKRLTATFLLT